MSRTERFKIILAREAFGKRWRVSTLPALVSYPSQYFKSHVEADAFARELSRVEGWPIDDQTEGAG